MKVCLHLFTVTEIEKKAHLPLALCLLQRKARPGKSSMSFISWALPYCTYRSQRWAEKSGTLETLYWADCKKCQAPELHEPSHRQISSFHILRWWLWAATWHCCSYRNASWHRSGCLIDSGTVYTALTTATCKAPLMNYTLSRYRPYKSGMVEQGTEEHQPFIVDE